MIQLLDRIAYWVIVTYVGIEWFGWLSESVDDFYVLNEYLKNFIELCYTGSIESVIVIELYSLTYSV